MSIHALSAFSSASSCAGTSRHAAPHAERRESVAAPRRGPEALRTALQDVVGEIGGAGAAGAETSADALHDFTGALFEAPAAPVADPAVAPTAPSALEASFAALWQTLQPATTAGTDGTAVDLIGFLHTLAQRLGTAAAPALSVGSLVDTSA